MSTALIIAIVALSIGTTDFSKKEASENQVTKKEVKKEVIKKKQKYNPYK